MLVHPTWVKSLPAPDLNFSPPSAQGADSPAQKNSPPETFWACRLPPPFHPTSPHSAASLPPLCKRKTPCPTLQTPLIVGLLLPHPRNEVSPHGVHIAHYLTHVWPPSLAQRDVFKTRCFPACQQLVSFSCCVMCHGLTFRLIATRSFSSSWVLAASTHLDQVSGRACAALAPGEHQECGAWVTHAAFSASPSPLTIGSAP